MTRRRDEQFLKLNNRWALAFDPFQWIVQRRAGIEWRAMSFISTKKRILLDVLDKKGVQPTHEANDALRYLPENFTEWHEHYQIMELGK